MHKETSRQKGVGTRKLHEASKSAMPRPLSLKGRQSPASVPQAIPDGLVSDPISETAKTVIKSGFGDVGLSTGDSILGLLSFFLTMLNTTWHPHVVFIIIKDWNNLAHCSHGDWCLWTHWGGQRSSSTSRH